MADAFLMGVIEHRAVELEGRALPLSCHAPCTLYATSTTLMYIIVYRLLSVV